MLLLFETGFLANRHAPAKENLEISLSEYAEIAHQRTNFIGRGRMVIEIHPSLLRGF